MHLCLQSVDVPGLTLKCRIAHQGSVVGSLSLSLSSTAGARRLHLLLPIISKIWLNVMDVRARLQILQLGWIPNRYIYTHQDHYGKGQLTLSW
jgi:hypothetical protein